MSQENKISSEISAEQLAEIKEKIDAIGQSLSSVLLFNLTADDRQSLRIMGDKSLAFVEKALGYADNNKTLVPSFLDLPEAKKDFALSRDLFGILQQVNTLQRALEDTILVVGSEALDAASIFYCSVKGASHVNVPGTDAIYQDLQKRFVGRPKKVKVQ